MNTSSRKLDDALLVMTRQPNAPHEREATGEHSFMPLAGEVLVPVYTCHENQHFLGDVSHRGQVAAEISERVEGEMVEGTQIYVLFHYPKRTNLEFISAQLGLVDFLLTRHPRIVHPTLVGIEGDEEMVANMRKVVAAKRKELRSSIARFPLLTTTLDRLGWADLEFLKSLAEQRSTTTCDMEDAICDPQ